MGGDCSSPSTSITEILLIQTLATQPLVADLTSTVQETQTLNSLTKVVLEANERQKAAIQLLEIYSRAIVHETDGTYGEELAQHSKEEVVSHTQI